MSVYLFVLLVHHLSSSLLLPVDVVCGLMLSYLFHVRRLTSFMVLPTRHGHKVESMAGSKQGVTNITSLCKNGGKQGDVPAHLIAGNLMKAIIKISFLSLLSTQTKPYNNTIQCSK